MFFFFFFFDNEKKLQDKQIELHYLSKTISYGIEKKHLYCFSETDDFFGNIK